MKNWEKVMKQFLTMVHPGVSESKQFSENTKRRCNKLNETHAHRENMQTSHSIDTVQPH